jgi:hypothetical protein
VPGCISQASALCVDRKAHTCVAPAIGALEAWLPIFFPKFTLAHGNVREIACARMLSRSCSSLSIRSLAIYYSHAEESADRNIFQDIGPQLAGPCQLDQLPCNRTGYRKVKGKQLRSGALPRNETKSVSGIVVASIPVIFLPGKIRGGVLESM